MTESSTAAHPDRPIGNTLSTEDRLTLATMLDESSPAPLAALRPGDDFWRGGREFLVIAKAGDRLALLGACAICDFPYVVTVNPCSPKPALAHRCDIHRHRPWAHTPRKPKRRGRKPKRHPEIQHEIAPRQAVTGRWTRGDVIRQAGHQYLVLCGERKVRNSAGLHFISAQLIVICSCCGTPFRFSTAAKRLDDQNARLRRRCAQHTAPHFAHRARPVSWSGKTLRHVARAAGMTLEELMAGDTPHSREARQ